MVASIKSDTIRRRLSRYRPLVTQLGKMYPLEAIELTIITIIVQMARIFQSLTPSQGLRLVNDMISGTNVQENLVKWKDRHTSNFDWSNWSTYGNFQ